MAELEAQAKALAAQMQARRDADKRVGKLAALIKVNGFTAEDFAAAVVLAPKAATRSRSASKGGGLPPKYWHPTDPKLTWSGKARAPGWLVELEKAGTKREDLMTKPASYPAQKAATTTPRKKAAKKKKR